MVKKFITSTTAFYFLKVTTDTQISNAFMFLEDTHSFVMLMILANGFMSIQFHYWDNR